MDLLLINIKELATPKGNKAKAGNEQGDVNIINNAMIGIKEDKIAYVGEMDDSIKGKIIIDCSNNLVTPGLIDSHTHLVFGGWRQNELGMKLEGVEYLEILRQGGGILSSVKSTREASEEELIEKTKKIVTTMRKYGTTTVEGKSGYGLNIETELKQLRVSKKVNELGIIDVVSTFMGAHAIPQEYKDNRRGFIDLLINEMLPKVAKENLATFCDIFCESSVFTPDESKEILLAAKELGFMLKIHGDEIDPIGGAEIAAEVGAISAEHLIMSSDEGIVKLGEAGVIACLLPSTSLNLGADFAKAQKMKKENVPIAVATDFNPGSSPNLNLQLAMYLACLKYKLTPKEVLTAVTLNAAACIDRSVDVGTLEVGKKADIVIWDAPDLNFIFYRYGDNLVESVIKNGVKVV